MRFLSFWRRRADGVAQAARMRRRHAVPVDQPLVLVSQAHRSGGSLLSQLLSDHPDCHAHPGEIHIGFPSKQQWPDLDLSGRPARWFEHLYEKRLDEYARDGYSKMPEHLRGQYQRSEVSFPFLFSRSLMRALFLERLGSERPPSQRRVLDAYFTAYFNAWLDYQGLYQPKRFVAGFTPGLASQAASVERFFRDYPDGFLVSVVRDPAGWFASLRKKREGRRFEPEEALSEWVESTRAALENQRRYGERVVLLRFDRLVGDTEACMRHLAGRLGLDFHPALLSPSFQGMPIRANSSYRVEEAGLIDGPRTRARELSEAEREWVAREAGDLHESALAAIGA